MSSIEDRGASAWSPLGGYRYLRPLLLRCPPEWMHHMSLTALGVAGKSRVGRALLQRAYAPRVSNVSHEVTRFGLTFPNAIGLAAGYDKNAVALEGLAALGFGHLEVGTVTLRPQRGNPGTRVRRIPAQSALVNRMGFPSAGAEVVATRLARYRERDATRSPVIGVNIGKNRDTPNERADDDYLALARRFAPLADYLTVNISSPNTPGLRDLQRLEALERLLSPLLEARESLRSTRGDRPPLLVKLAPELLGEAQGTAEIQSVADVQNAAETQDAFDQLITRLSALGVEGVILANTRRVETPLAGGLSGAPLFDHTLELTRRAKRVAPHLSVVASGGVGAPEQALELQRQGADLVQIWTALIYRGPHLIRHLSEALSAE